ncbi:PDZ and LIM domain protein 4-like [Gigantopelta aegis]|uniref:PDZ and LIM domain protein 4-like n=1 Tax=Gigantopelta aegis TaxID=1735272 RepID=UPI001B88D867|nr:PDZ and LIM domain protein 4-like [Gigantopelta aegis]
MAAPHTVMLQRRGHEPWGFRLQGGRDFRMELSVKKIMPGSPAEGQLHQGDVIMSIGQHRAHDLTHMQAQQLIKNAGSSLQLGIQAGANADFANIKPKGPIKFSPWRQR